MTQSRTVPIWLREVVSKWCSVQPFSFFGKRAYTFVANFCAKRLLRIPGAKSIFLRGKEPKDSDPGISDLDFWLFVDREQLKQRVVISNLRAKYLSLRSRFVLPGKLEVTDSHSWELFRQLSPASFAQDLPLFRFTDGEWRNELITPARDIGALSRFNKNIQNFQQAFSYLPTSVSGSNTFYSSLILGKFIAKASEAPRIGELSICDQREKAKRISETIIFLNSLAKDVLNTSIPQVEANITIVHSPKVDVGFTPEALKLLNYLTNRIASAHFYLERGFVSDYIVWDVEEPDVSTAERIVSFILEFYRTELSSINKESLFPLTLVTRLMRRTLWLSSQVGPLLENLSEIPEEFKGDPRYFESLKCSLFQYLTDRLVTRLNHNLGVLVSYKPDTFVKPLLYQCVELAVVSSRHITNDLNLLRQSAKGEVPMTSKWLGRLASGELPEDYDEWIQSYIEVREEAFATLNSLLCAELGRKL